MCILCSLNYDYLQLDTDIFSRNCTSEANKSNQRPLEAAGVVFHGYKISVSIAYYSYFVSLYHLTIYLVMLWLTCIGVRRCFGEISSLQTLFLSVSIVSFED
jgi:hypothetical protein